MTLKKLVFMTLPLCMSSMSHANFDNFEEESKQRLLVIYKNNVMDLTDFNHPGGRSVIERQRGKDITKTFPHSFDLLKRLPSNVIGVYDEEVTPNEEVASKNEVTSNEEDTETHIELRSPYPGEALVCWFSVTFLGFTLWKQLRHAFAGR